MTIKSSTLTSSKAALATIAEIVTFLFAAFNGYLKAIAPPVSRVGGMDAPAAVGFASFAALLIFLYAKVWMRYLAPARWRVVWMGITGLLVIAYVGTGFVYQARLDDATFLFPVGTPNGTREVYGHELTTEGTRMVETFRASFKRDPLPAELIATSGGEVDKMLVRIWSVRSILSAHDTITRWYVAFVVVLATAIACLIELMLATPAEPESSNTNAKSAGGNDRRPTAAGPGVRAPSESPIKTLDDPVAR